MKQVILILGMHRSATSAIAGVFAGLGAAAPKTLIGANASNQKGHFESSVIARFNDRLLEALGSAWFDWREIDSLDLSEESLAAFESEACALLADEFGDVPLIVLKDPRICRLVPFWLRVLATAGYTPKIILPVRDPLQVARSLQARNGFSLDTGLLLWLQHVISAWRGSEALPRVAMASDAFLANPGLARSVACRLDLAALRDVETGPDPIVDMVEPGLYHVAAGRDNGSGAFPGTHDGLVRLADALFDAVLHFCQNDNAAVCDAAVAGAQGALNDVIAPTYAATGDLLKNIHDNADDRSMIRDLRAKIAHYKTRLAESQTKASEFRTKYRETLEAYKALKYKK